MMIINIPNSISLEDIHMVTNFVASLSEPAEKFLLTNTCFTTYILAFIANVL
jgi:hypothetical protein